MRDEVKEKVIKIVGEFIKKRLSQLDMQAVKKQLEEIGLNNFIERIYWEGAAICAESIGKYYVFDENMVSQLNPSDLKANL